MIKVILTLLSIGGSCWAGGCSENLAVTQPKIANANSADANSIDEILNQLSQKTSELKSYQCRIEYRFSQPLFESQTLRKGDLYYQKTGKKTKLRINFQTLKQDDEKEQKYIEQYIFDGAWLTHIDYQIRQVKKHQLAESDELVDVFEFVSQNFPIIGFTGIDKLKKEFEIELGEQQGSKGVDFTHLHLKVKPDSIYKADYTSIEFWINKGFYLPAEIIAVSVEEDIYRIQLLEPKVNKEIDKGVFDVKVSEGFGEDIILLKEVHR